MRLYSRSQLIVVAAITAVCAIAGTAAVVFLADSGTDVFVSSRVSRQPFSLQSSYTSIHAIPVESGPGLSADELQTIRVYDERNAGVVNISTETVTYNWFLEPIPREGGTGSGSIIDSRGYVLTNYHVVERAVKVFITLSDGERIEGDVIGADPENDLAVIKVDPGERVLRTIPFGESSSLRIGQKVLAIGNPFGLDRTLTTGIVSGLGRPVRASTDRVIRDMIQTDASINPGNSGGPLLDGAGNMVGINTAIYSPSRTGGSIGIGFAVPVDTARRVVPDLIQFGQVRRGWIEMIPREIIPQLAQYANLPVSEGLLISQVTPGGNAEKAGLVGGSRSAAVRIGATVVYLGGDIVVEVNGVRTKRLSDLFEALEDTRPGDGVSVTYIRDGETRETTVALSERPSRTQWD
ncbi:MAG: PDZ domain-containing protein [Spirochaetaceae bacterium]|nr:MAG: PDZ domain-containing protein [Spirochaetaceae bacterium]